MMRTHVAWRGLLAALATAGIFALTSCSQQPASARPGAGDDPYDLVIAYLKAVNTGDANNVKPLVDPAFDADSEIQHRLQEYGRKGLYYQQMRFDSAGFKDSTTVTVTARSGYSSDQRLYTDTLQLEQKSGRWYLVLGKPR
jgi:hypothetical protein